MARYLDKPNASGGTTDHAEEIVELRAMAAEALADSDSMSDEGVFTDGRLTYLTLNLAADLLEAHDQTGISLDDWPYARQLVEALLESPVLPNCV